MEFAQALKLVLTGSFALGLFLLMRAIGRFNPPPEGVDGFGFLRFLVSFLLTFTFYALLDGAWLPALGLGAASLLVGAVWVKFEGLHAVVNFLEWVTKRFP